MLLIIFGSGYSAFSQTTPSPIAGNKATSKISGRIIDMITGDAAKYATVTIIDKSTSKAVDRKVTNENGIFSSKKIMSGIYKVSVSFVGYQSFDIDVSVADNSDVTMDTIRLIRDSNKLADVLVKTDKPLIEERADRLIYNAEKDISAMGGTAADLLRNVPMISVDGSGNVQLRGSSNIRVLINNRPSTIIASSTADALRQIPADMIKTVEVITSPSAKYDAEGTAGIVNIITKKNMLQGVTGNLNLIPGNVSTIGSGGINYRRRKLGLNSNISINQFYNTGTTYLERLTYSNKALFTQVGKTKNNSGFISPGVGFDYTFDDRNSIAGGIRLNPSHDNVRNRQVVTNTRPGSASTVSNLELVNKTKAFGYDFNLDYLRTFKDPQQELSFLTLYSIFNSDNEANQDHFNDNKQLYYLQRNLNQSQNLEGTFQVDYTQPLKNKTTFEIGAKTVLRKASSDVDYRNTYPLNGTSTLAENIFSYHQNVWASYITYNFQMFKNLNIKVGTRYENTGIDADYKTNNTAFSTGYDNLLPSLNMSYTHNKKHTFRFNFTQRLQRPQLFYLNPYREVISPQIVRVGNPQLNAEVADLFEISYGTYKPNFSLNTSVFSRVTNNAIASSISLVNDTSYLTFLNIASNKTYGTNFSTLVKPLKTWSINANLNVYYVDLEGVGVSNSGFMFTSSASTTIDFGKGWFYSFTGNFNSRRVTLQGRMAAFYYHNTTLRKDILKKRGAIGINLANPFMRGTRVRNNLMTPEFEQREDNINYTRGIRGTFTLRFGALQQQKAPRKARKNINNDDALRG
jgi:outer membrane receptor protein involved in Fe transport